MSEVTEMHPIPTPITLDAQLPGGDRGFSKYATATEDGEEIAGLEEHPIEPVGTSSRMGLVAGSRVSYESFIMSVVGFTDDGDGNERVVVTMGDGGIALDEYLICRPEILEPVTTWSFRGSTAPRRIGDVVPDKGQWLYIIRDCMQRVIYIGISVNAPNRWTQHQADKPWFRDAASFERIWYPTREAVEDAEAYLIAIVRPPYNTVHNPDRRERK